MKDLVCNMNNFKRIIKYTFNFISSKLKEFFSECFKYREILKLMIQM